MFLRSIHHTVSCSHRWSVALVLVCIFIGCDTSPQAGDQLYALKNPTREWRIAETTSTSQISDNTPQTENELETTSKPKVELIHPLSIDPPMLVAARVRPDRTTKSSTLISSQHWQDFSLTDLSSELSGLTWEIEPADESLLQMIGARSGWLLTASVPAGLPDGQITDSSIRMLAKSAEQVLELEVPLRVQVLRRVAVYGDGIDKSGTLSFGVQPRGVAHRRKVVVKVNDQQPKLELESITTKPEFLQVQLSPYDKDTPEKNLYYLDVEIPANAPEYVSHGAQLGKITLTFAGHPRIKQLKLHVDFVIQGSARSYLTALNADN